MARNIIKIPKSEYDREIKDALKKGYGQGYNEGFREGKQDAIIKTNTPNYIREAFGCPPIKEPEFLNKTFNIPKEKTSNNAITLKVPIKIDGLEAITKALKRTIDTVRTPEIIKDEYGRGFFDAVNVIMDCLDKLQRNDL